MTKKADDRPRSRGRRGAFRQGRIKADLETALAAPKMFTYALMFYPLIKKRHCPSKQQNHSIMSRISGLRNDMNKRTLFYKERKINNSRCFDFLSKQI